jgi:hypothetical protein
MLDSPGMGESLTQRKANLREHLKDRLLRISLILSSPLLIMELPRRKFHFS